MCLGLATISRTMGCGERKTPRGTVVTKRGRLTTGESVDSHKELTYDNDD